MFFKNRSEGTLFPPVIINSETIQQVRFTKFLGVFVDEYLNWKIQINNVNLKLSKACGIIHRVRNQLTQKALLNVYFTLCYPYMMYCVSVWGCTWPSFLKEVIVAQKRIIRIMCHKGKYDHTEELIKKLHLLYFPSVQKYFLLLAIFKSLHRNNENSEGSVFSRTAHDHGTRSSPTSLVCPVVRTTLCLNSVLCAGPRLWNSLPPTIRSATTINLFKKQIKLFFRNV